VHADDLAEVPVMRTVRNRRGGARDRPTTARPCGLSRWTRRWIRNDRDEPYEQRV